MAADRKIQEAAARPVLTSASRFRSDSVRRAEDWPVHRPGDR